MDVSHAVATVGVGLTVAGIVTGTAKFRPGLDVSIRDRVDLGAYVLRGVGSAAALYGLLAVDVTAWWISLSGTLLGAVFLVGFWGLTRPNHGPVGEGASGQDDQDRDSDAKEVSHV